MKFKKAIVSVAIIVTVVFTAVASFAAVGHQRTSSSSSSHSSSSSSKSSGRSSSSYSGSTSSRSSRSSSGSSSSSYSGGSSSGTLAEGIGGTCCIISVVAIIIIVVLLSSKKKGNNINMVVPNNNHPNNNQSSNSKYLPDNTKAVETQIRTIDPMFSAEDFLTFSKEVFIKLQAAWTKRDWSGIRPFESNELFAQHSSQLQELIDDGKINVIERVAVNNARLIKFEQDGDKEVLTMAVDSVMRDYVIDDKTKQVVEGNKNEDIYVTFKMTFMRKAGVKTKEGTSKTNTTNCPNCGAPTQITSAGRCEFCGSVITTGEHDWVLTNYESVV